MFEDITLDDKSHSSTDYFSFPWLTEFFTSLKTLFKCHNFNIVLKFIPSFYFGGIWKNICTTHTYTIFMLNNTFYLIFSSKPYFICNDKIVSANLISNYHKLKCWKFKWVHLMHLYITFYVIYYLSLYFFFSLKDSVLELNILHFITLGTRA